VKNAISGENVALVYVRTTDPQGIVEFSSNFYFKQVHVHRNNKGLVGDGITEQQTRKNVPFDNISHLQGFNGNPLPGLVVGGQQCKR
jgi:hypothetical protein